MRTTALALLALAALTATAQAGEPCRTPNGTMPATDSRAPMKPGDSPRMHCTTGSMLLHTPDGGTVTLKTWDFTMRDYNGNFVSNNGGVELKDIKQR